MIEFYTNHYHVYGRRAGKVSETVQEARNATKFLDLSDDRTRYTFEVTTKNRGFFTSGEPLSFYDLDKQVSRFDGVEFLSISSEAVSLWSDIDPAPNPRSGIATRTKIVERNRELIRQFTTVRMSDRDLADVAGFLARETLVRYGL
jgi:hypothetical protein